jgi:hypothetical protein
MSRALVWIRKSKGSDDDIGLQKQREEVPALAGQLAEQIDLLDLGVHTGFSTMTRDGSDLLDQNPDVQSKVDDLEDGRYDYLVAWDDRRICRDEYLNVIQYAAQSGNAEFVYVGDVQEDDLTFDLKRRIERDTKEEEIEKSRQAVQERLERGYDHGRPRFGMTYDENSRYQVPGDDFETVLEILERAETDESLQSISDDLELPVSTVYRVDERREWYEDRAERNGVEV